MCEMTDPYPTFLELQVVGEDTGHSWQPQTVGVWWECLGEAPVCEIFNLHRQENFNNILRDVEGIDSKMTVFHTEVAAWSWYASATLNGDRLLKISVTSEQK